MVSRCAQKVSSPTKCKRKCRLAPNPIYNILTRVFKNIQVDYKRLIRFELLTMQTGKGGKRNPTYFCLKIINENRMLWNLSLNFLCTKVSLSSYKRNWFGGMLYSVFYNLEIVGVSVETLFYNLETVLFYFLKFERFITGQFLVTGVRVFRC